MSVLVGTVVVPSKEGSVKVYGGQERPDVYGYVWGGGGVSGCTGSAAAVH